jgi:hypothetical protein
MSITNIAPKKLSLAECYFSRAVVVEPAIKEVLPCFLLQERLEIRECGGRSSCTRIILSAKLLFLPDFVGRWAKPTLPKSSDHVARSRFVETRTVLASQPRLRSVRYPNSQHALQGVGQHTFCQFIFVGSIVV